jgi:hypothetical protein
MGLAWHIFTWHLFRLITYYLFINLTLLSCAGRNVSIHYQIVQETKTIETGSVSDLCDRLIGSTLEMRVRR